MTKEMQDVFYCNIKEGDKHSDVVVQNEGVGVVIEARSDKQNELISKNISEGSFLSQENRDRSSSGQSRDGSKYLGLVEGFRGKLA